MTPSVLIESFFPSEFRQLVIEIVAESYLVLPQPPDNHSTVIPYRELICIEQFKGNVQLSEVTVTGTTKDHLVPFTMGYYDEMRT